MTTLQIIGAIVAACIYLGLFAVLARFCATNKYDENPNNYGVRDD